MMMKEIWYMQLEMFETVLKCESILFLTCGNLRGLRSDFLFTLLFA